MNESDKRGKRRAGGGPRGLGVPLILLLFLLLSPAALFAQDAGVQLYGQGVSLYREKRYSEALELFESLRLQFPDSRKADDALYYIGRVHRREQRPEQAEAAFRQILALPSTNRRVEAAYQLGLISYKRRDYAPVVELLEPLKKESELDDEDEDLLRLLARSYYNLGILAKKEGEADRAQRRFYKAVETFTVLAEGAASVRNRAVALGGIGKSYGKLADLAGSAEEAGSYRAQAVEWLDRAIPLAGETEAGKLEALRETLLQEAASPAGGARAAPAGRGRARLEALGGTDTLVLWPGVRLSAAGALKIPLARSHTLELYTDFDHDSFDLKTFNFLAAERTAGDVRLIQRSDRIDAGLSWRTGRANALYSKLGAEAAAFFAEDPEDTYLSLNANERLRYRLSTAWKLTLDTSFTWKTFPNYLVNGRELDYLLAEAVPAVTRYLPGGGRAALEYAFSLKQYLNARYDTATIGVPADRNRRYLTQGVGLNFRGRPGAMVRPAAGYSFSFNKSYNYDLWVEDSAGPPGRFVSGYWDYLEHELTAGFDVHLTERLGGGLEGSFGYRSFLNYPVRDAGNTFTGELRRDFDLGADLTLSYLIWPKTGNGFADTSLLIRASYLQAISNMLYEAYFDTNYTSVTVFAGIGLKLP